MKSRILSMIALGVIVAISQTAVAALTFVSPTLRNGGIEDATVSGSPASATFADTDFWTNIGGGETTAFTRTDLEFPGGTTPDQNGVYGEATSTVPAIDTGYTIVANAKIDISYFWRDAFNWNDAGDRMKVSFYVTGDNTIEGTRTDLATFVSSASASNSSFQEETGTYQTTASDAGKRLFAAFESNDGGGGAVGFARLDDVTITNPYLILVDHDDEVANGIHDVAIRNGGFESPASVVDGEPFSNTDNWVNLQGLQSHNARRTNINDTGDYSTVNSDSTSLQYGLDTEYTIGWGDEFYLEFRARNAASATAASTITAELYYTADDTIGGVATVIDSIIVSGMSTTFATFSDTFDAIASGDGAIGKNLFLRFEQSSGPGFTRTDSWYLTVAQVPSPAALPAGLILMTTLAMRRRRRA